MAHKHWCVSIPFPHSSHSSQPSPSSSLLATSSSILPSKLTNQLTTSSSTPQQINQLLTTTPLASTTDGVLLTLPATTTPLPREKPLPAAKETTKWEKFAARKGIKPKTREQRSLKNRSFNEETGEWERTWGHDRGGKATDRRRARDEGAVQRDWLVEVDENGEPEGASGGGGGGGAKGAKGAKGKKRKA